MSKNQKVFVTILVLVAIVLVVDLVRRPRHNYMLQKNEPTTATSIENRNDTTVPFVVIDDATISTLIADTPALQMKGLGGRASLEPDQGMLFIFDSVGMHDIWMKDMKFSIDIIWINEDWEIVDIKKHATPESYPNIVTPREKNAYVLEVRDGFVDQHGIKIGDTVTPSAYFQ